ncbi:hypothetical protein Tco_0789737 [Tanacetum coccineum]
MTLQLLGKRHDKRTLFLHLPMIHLLMVLDLEKAKDSQAKEIVDLKKMVQRLERKKTSRTTDASKQERRIEDIDKDADVSLVDDTQGRSDDADMFDIDDLHGDELNVDMPVGENQEQSVKEREVDTSVEGSAAPTTIKKITLAQIKSKQLNLKLHRNYDLARNLQAQLEAEIIEEEKLARKQEEEANLHLYLHL